MAFTKALHMRILSRSAVIHALLYSVVAYYAVACSSTDFVHNHEPDTEFHHDCPACQWQTMSQDDFSGAISILDILSYPLSFVGFKTCLHELFMHTDSCGTSCLSRAPPLPT